MMVHVNRRQEHEGLRTLEFFFGLILKFFILGFLFLSTEVANLIEPRGSHMQYVRVVLLPSEEEKLRRKRYN